MASAAEELEITLKDLEAARERRAKALKARSELSTAKPDVARELERLRRSLTECASLSKKSSQLKRTLKNAFEISQTSTQRVRALERERAFTFESLEKWKASKMVELCCKRIKNLNVSLREKAQIVKDFRSVKDFASDATLEYATMDRASKEVTELVSKTLNESSSMDFHSKKKLIRDVMPEKAVSEYANAMAGSLKSKLVAVLTSSEFKWEINADSLKVESVPRRTDFVKVSAELLKLSAFEIEEWRSTDLPDEVIHGHFLHEFDKLASVVLSALYAEREVRKRVEAAALATASDGEDPAKAAVVAADVNWTDDASDPRQILSKLLVELCLTLQRFESFERFSAAVVTTTTTTSRVDDSVHPKNELLRELSPSYAALEKAWIVSSMRVSAASGKQEKATCRLVGGNVGDVFSLVDEHFYLAKQSLKRSLATGVVDACRGVVHHVLEAFSDESLPSFRKDKNDDDFVVRLNSIELASSYSSSLHRLLKDEASSSLDDSSETENLLASASSFNDLTREFDHMLSAGISEVASVDALSVESFGEAFVRGDDDDDETDVFAIEILKWLRVNFDFKQQLSTTIHLNIYEKLAAKICKVALARIAATPRVDQLGGLNLEREIRMVKSGTIELVSKTLLEAVGDFRGNSKSSTTAAVNSSFDNLLLYASLLTIDHVRDVHDVFESESRPNLELTKSILRKRADFSENEIDALIL